MHVGSKEDLKKGSMGTLRRERACQAGDREKLWEKNGTQEGCEGLRAAVLRGGPYLLSRSIFLGWWPWKVELCYELEEEKNPGWMNFMRKGIE